MSMHFDLTDLRLLAEVAEVAEANSVTGGAQALHLSVPAASTRIKNLEESIGAKLLLWLSGARTDQAHLVSYPE